MTVRYETSLTHAQKSDSYSGPTNCIIMDVGPQTKELKSGKKRNVENPYFDYTICIGCSTCVKVCPASCLHMEPISNSSSSGLTKENASQEA